VNIREISYLKSFKIQHEDDEIDSNNDSNNDSDEDQEFESDDESNYSSDDQDEFNHHLNQTKQSSLHLKRKKRELLKRKKREKLIKTRSYFHFIKYAIHNTSIRSVHVNMRPCYGFDITPSSGHLLDVYSGFDFIETSLPKIRPPENDFHHYCLLA
jgi:hypothetical protein